MHHFTLHFLLALCISSLFVKCCFLLSRNFAEEKWKQWKWNEKIHHCNDKNNEYFNNKSCQHKIVCNLFEEIAVKLMENCGVEKEREREWNRKVIVVQCQPTDQHLLLTAVAFTCIYPQVLFNHGNGKLYNNRIRAHKQMPFISLSWK